MYRNNDGILMRVAGLPATLRYNSRLAGPGTPHQQTAEGFLDIMRIPNSASSCSPAWQRKSKSNLPNSRLHRPFASLSFLRGLVY
jgi:hypothetical protein